jgi:3-hydroxymyristoyl/3-hydroxydecanoyl-(acyl carrier protein) dehydratase
MNGIRNQLKSMLTVERREGGYRAHLKLEADFSILPDHFANEPILPGMCLTQAILIAGAMAINESNLHLMTLKNAKLVGPIFPGDVVDMDVDVITDPAGNFIIKAKVTGDGKKKAEISLLARAGNAGKVSQS